jgi:outer membrane protein assembly factor BamC
MTVHRPQAMRAITLALAILPLLSACSLLQKMPGMDKVTGENGWFHDRKGEYLQAETIPRTKIPADKDSYIIDDLLVIPDLPEGAEQQAFLEPPRPRAIEGRSEREVVIQRMEGRSWIVVDVSPSQVWPRIRDYWRQNNVVIAAENPTTGLMETGWFVLDGNALTQERFRVSVETGFQDNSAEIRLLHMEAPQSTPVIAQLPFPASSVNADTEYTVLSSLSSYLADVADLYQASSVSFLAGNIDSRGKAVIATTPAGSQILQLKAEYNRSWAAISRALQRAGVEVVAQDNAQGIFDVVYMPGKPTGDEEDESGFFHSVWTLGGLFSGDGDLESYKLRIQLLKTTDSIDVLATPESASPENQAAGNSLLELLRNTLA